MAIRIISATRAPETEFWQNMPLGRSLNRLKFDGAIVSHIAFQNSVGLPLIYNPMIEMADDDDVLVFVHDDVWLDDYFLNFRVMEALQHFQVVGVSGNRVRVPGQYSWAFSGPNSSWGLGTISGCVAHGDEAFGEVSFFGPLPSACELLDGVFLVCRASTLKANGLRFDPQFDFHFYDLDFCRSARQLGLTLGTWPIAMTHQSGGVFFSDGWHVNHHRYFAKWGN